MSPWQYINFIVYRIKCCVFDWHGCIYNIYAVRFKRLRHTKILCYWMFAFFYGINLEIESLGIWTQYIIISEEFLVRRILNFGKRYKTLQYSIFCRAPKKSERAARDFYKFIMFPFFYLCILSLNAWFSSALMFSSVKFLCIAFR